METAVLEQRELRRELLLLAVAVKACGSALGRALLRKGTMRSHASCSDASHHDAPLVLGPRAFRQLLGVGTGLRVFR